MPSNPSSAQPPQASPSGPPILRAATNRDRQAVIELVSTALREYGLKLYLDGTDRELQDLEGSYAARGGIFDVLEAADGAIVGSVGLCPMDARDAELRKMYLRADHRGQGLGRRLLQHAIEQARRMGYRRIVLATDSVLKEAIALYTSAGFRPYEMPRRDECCNRSYALDLDGAGI